MKQGAFYDLNSALQAVKDQGLMKSLCTIQTRTNTVNATGQVNLSTWVDIAGLVNIACMVSVQRVFSPDQYGVDRKPEQFQERAEKHAILDGYFPAIIQQYTAVVDGQRYEIMAVEPVSQQTYTRLGLRRFNQ